jgi:hypothetical protein
VFGNKKLLRDGAQLDGVLIESDDGKVLVNAASSYHVKVRVTFEDGTLGEFEDRLHTKDAGMKGIGAVVPVRFDPSDRTKIAVDGPELHRRRETDAAQREAAFAATPEPLASASPSAQLQELWTQKKAMDARGSELRRTGAPREEVGAWVHESEALDARFRALKAQHPDWAPSAGA